MLKPDARFPVSGVELNFRKQLNERSGLEEVRRAVVKSFGKDRLKIEIIFQV